MSKHRRLPRACRVKGHAWRQKVWGVAGMEVCARRNCDEERVDPKALPPVKERVSPLISEEA